MTDKPNALQVVSRDLLERLHGWLTHIHHYRAEDLADLESALKKAPALDGEPGVLGRIVAFSEGVKEVSWAKGKMPKLDVELIDRVQVAPLLAEIERLTGLQPEWPPRPPEGNGLPRFGLRWNGPSQPLAVPMDDGYWTPWHLADRLQAELDAYKASRERLHGWIREEQLKNVHLRAELAERDTLLHGVLEFYDDGVGRSDEEWKLIQRLRAALPAAEHEQ